VPESRAPVATGPSFLSRLYPRAWRDRYGEELEALLAERRPTFGMLIDLLGGVLDAWLSPQTNVIDQERTVKMNAYLLSTCCSSGGHKPTLRESLVGAATMLLGTLALVTAHWALKQTYGALPAIVALKDSFVTFSILLCANGLYLQRRSWRAQVTFVGLSFAMVYLLILGFN
jgi:hypothetical protein